MWTLVEEVEQVTLQVLVVSVELLLVAEELNTMVLDKEEEVVTKQVVPLEPLRRVREEFNKEGGVVDHVY